MPLFLSFLLVCKAKMDLAFVVDASSSVGRKNFRRLKRFLQRLVSAFSISPRFVKVGIVLYSSRRKVITIPLNRFPTLSQLKRIIWRLPYLRGGTFTGYALEVAKNRLLAKSSRKKTLLVFTDGKSGDSVLKPVQGSILLEK